MATAPYATGGTARQMRVSPLFTLFYSNSGDPRTGDFGDKLMCANILRGFFPPGYSGRYVALTLFYVV